MNQRKNRLAIVVSMIGILLHISAGEVKELLFIFPVIYEPVIQMVSAQNQDLLNDRQPRKKIPVKVTMEIIEFVPGEADRKQFDDFREISYKEIPGTQIQIFKKDGLVQQLRVIKAEKDNSSQTVYDRNWKFLTSRIPQTPDNEAYILKTRDILTVLLKREAVLTDFPPGKYALTFEFRLYMERGVIGEVCFPDFCLQKFSCYQNILNNNVLKNKNGNPVFFFTYNLNYITQGGLFGKNSKDGFIAYFYPNQGLLFLTEMKNGEYQPVTAWGRNGRDEKKIPVDEWQSNLSRLIKEAAEEQK